MITTVVLTGYGICQVTNEGEDPKPESLKGYFLLSDTIAFVEQTDSFPLKTGLRFGIEYVLQGVEEVNAETFEVAITHPLLHNPVTNNSSTQALEVKAGCIGEPSFDYYYLEHDWELKPGQWLFQVTQSNKLLMEKAFNLYS